MVQFPATDLCLGRNPRTLTGRCRLRHQKEDSPSTGITRIAPMSGLDLSESQRPPKKGATGFDTIVLREEAGRGLLATLNRGNVNLIGKAKTQSAPALAMAA